MQTVSFFFFLSESVGFGVDVANNDDLHAQSDQRQANTRLTSRRLTQTTKCHSRQDLVSMSTPSACHDGQTPNNEARD